MKLIAPRPSASAGTLTIVLTTMAIIGVALAGYLGLVSNNQRAMVRAEAWNAALPVAEAGIEEAMAHLNENYPTNMIGYGWTGTTNNLARSRTFLSGRYEVQVDVPGRLATILSTGQVDTAGEQGLVSRAVRVTALYTGVVNSALCIRDSLKLNGYNIMTDSYDSRDPLHSLNGRYFFPTRMDRGDISVASDESGAMNLGNSKIYGKVHMAQNGRPVMGAVGAVGSLAWHAGGNTGIQNGWAVDDCVAEFPDVEAPFTTAAPPPSGGGYDYVLGNGNYALTKFSGRVLVTGNASIYVSDTLQFTGTDRIQLALGSSLTIYAACKDASIGGLGVLNLSGVATNFTYYGLPTNTRLSLGGTGEFSGLVYAPSADIQMNGGGNIYGSIVGQSGSMNGNFNIHFDEALREGRKDLRHFVVVSWNEIY